MKGSKVSSIIPTKEKIGLLRPCLTSLLGGTGYTNYEMLLVDNGSREAATKAYQWRGVPQSRVGGDPEELAR